MTAIPPIDASALAEISGGDAATEREFLAQFRAFNAKDAAALIGAAEKSDLPGMVHFAHRIVGAARSVGATALGQATARVERACRDNDLAGARSHMPAVVAELGRLEAYLDTLALPR